MTHIRTHAHACTHTHTHTHYDHIRQEHQRQLLSVRETLPPCGASHLLLLLAPLQFLLHDLHHSGKGLVGCLHVLEGQPRPAANHIDCCSSVLLVDCILHFSLNVREVSNQASANHGPSVARHRRELGNLRCLVTIATGQVPSNLQTQRILHQTKHQSCCHSLLCCPHTHYIGGTQMTMHVRTYTNQC